MLLACSSLYLFLVHWSRLELICQLFPTSIQMSLLVTFFRGVNLVNDYIDLYVKIIPLDISSHVSMDFLFSIFMKIVIFFQHKRWVLPLSLSFRLFNLNKLTTVKPSISFLHRHVFKCIFSLSFRILDIRAYLWAESCIKFDAITIFIKKFRCRIHIKIS